MVAKARAAGTYTATKARELKAWLSTQIKAVRDWAKKLRATIAKKALATKDSIYAARSAKQMGGIGPAMKTKTKVGLGVAAGAALAGGGYAAYKAKKKKAAEKK